MASRDRVADAEDCKNRGNAALSSGDFDKAVQWYTEAIKLHPSHVYYSNRSAAYLSKNFADSALKDAETCLKLDASFVKGYSRKGAALHKLRQYEKAIAAYEEGLKLEPNNKGLIDGLEAVKQEQNPTFNFPNSNSASNGSDPNSPFGSMNIAETIKKSPKLMSYMSDPSFVNMINDVQGNPDKMSQYMSDPRLMEVITEMIGLDPTLLSKAKDRENEDKEKKEKLAKQRQKEREDREEKERAQKEKEEFEKLNPEEQQAILDKKKAVELKDEGNALYKSKEFEKAIKKYDEAIQLDSENYTFYFNKSAVVLEIGDLEKCIELCQKALEVAQKHNEDYKNLAKIFSRMGNAYLKHNQFDNAIKFYTKSLLEFKTPEVQKSLKTAEAKKKKTEEMEYLNPELAKEAKEKGNELFKNGNFPESVKFYTEAIKRSADSEKVKAVYYNNRAASYMKLMDFGRAMDDTKKSIKIDPTYIKAYSRKGNIELFLKEYHKAMDTFKLALTIEKDNVECQTGLNKTMELIQLQNMSNSNMTEEERIQRAQRSMEDPEIRNIMSDPVMKSVLSDMQSDPKAARKHLENPEVAAKVERLIAAGIVQTR